MRKSANVVQGVCGMLLGILWMSVALIPAHAIPGPVPPDPGCSDGGFDPHVQATQGTQAGNHQGVKSNVWFGVAANDCVRVSSINVLSDSGTGFVEWGWNLGWLYGTDTEGGLCGPTTVHHTTPVRFAISKPDGGAIHCFPQGEVSGNQLRLLTLADSNSDTVWEYSQGSSQIATTNVNFDRGTLVTNAERSNPGDSMWAQFKDLKFQVAGTSTWPAFSDLDPFKNGDLEYKCRMYSQTHQKVEKYPLTCIDAV